ncbi:hypothetical protein AVEN_23045-1 [Araneus ventricosus]|uniref:DUF7041 domain-containing protein n=1 Tax=Araneus ventricosus TaxID=182803 RepID=A0A4Y2L3M2_ARAVE|nr:hypothetical protein AVEN_23045-1 [Araneus ventricosus]
MEEVSAVKIPIFIPSDSSLWFTMVESSFELPPDIAMTVRDIIISPDKTDPYAKLKNEVISRCGESKSQGIRRLLAGEQLSDLKPSELLRVMQRRAENHTVADSFLLELFSQQLPSNVQSILASISPLTSQKAAEIADKILDISPAQVSAVSDSCSRPNVTPDCELLKELKLLRKEIALLRRSRNHSRNQPRFRQKSPAGKDELCWYHRKFGSKADKCLAPCSFQENSKGKE